MRACVLEGNQIVQCSSRTFADAQKIMEGPILFSITKGEKCMNYEKVIKSLIIKWILSIFYGPAQLL